MLQPLQLSGSLAGLTHWPSQQVRPTPHEGAHAPTDEPLDPASISPLVPPLELPPALLPAELLPVDPVPLEPLAPDSLPLRPAPVEEVPLADPEDASGPGGTWKAEPPQSAFRSAKLDATAIHPVIGRMRFADARIRPLASAREPSQEGEPSCAISRGSPGAMAHVPLAISV